MIHAGPNEKVHPVTKLVTMVDALQAEGVDPAKALAFVRLSRDDLASAATRVSLNQIIRCYRNAVRLAPDWRFAYRAGLRFHVSTYGMYGFAILTSANFRQTMRFAQRYHQLATPLADVSFREEAEHGVWTIAPLPHPDVDDALYRFLVELQFGIHVSLHRDVMGPAFKPRRLEVAYGPSSDAPDYGETFGCQVAFGQPENKFIFDSTWLDGAPTMGNDLTYASALALCDQLIEEFQQRAGVVGQVREALLVNLARPTSFNAVAKHLKIATRTLRRRLKEEDTSFRKLLDELRTQVAIKYLRDTDLTVEDIAQALDFSEAANFRHAFRRWTDGAPHQFRRVA